MNNIKKFFHTIHKKLMASKWVNSPKHYSVILGLGIVIVALVVFQAGIAVGYHKATFGDRMGKEYYRAFDKRGADGKRDFKMMKGKERMPAGFGAAGKVVKIEGSRIVIEEKDNTEKFVEITEQTMIRKFKEEITKDKIAVDDFAVIIGEPNTDGVIIAKLIRLLPAPEANTAR